MTPVIVALYKDHSAAERVRTQLVVEGGLPTDRVELTSSRESGQAGTEPGTELIDRLANYFHTIFDQTEDDALAEEFALRVDGGFIAITVHPRSDAEIDSTRLILHRNGAETVEEVLH